MNIKDLYEREKRVVLYGQTVRFRIIKYIVLFVLFGAFYIFRGFNNTLVLLAGFFVLSLIIHFFFRWKSKGWTQSWWLYKHTSVDGK